MPLAGWVRAGGTSHGSSVSPEPPGQTRMPSTTPSKAWLSPCPQCLAGPKTPCGTTTGELTHPKHKDRSTDHSIAQFKATSDSSAQAVTLLQGMLGSPITSIPGH